MNAFHMVFFHPRITTFEEPYPVNIGTSHLSSAAAETPIEGQRSEAARVQARMRLLVAATQAVAGEFDLTGLYRRIARSARELVDANHVALCVMTASGVVTQLVQLEAGDINPIIMPVRAGELDGLSDLVPRLTPGAVARFTAADLRAPLPGLWAEGMMAVPVLYRGRTLAVLMLSPALSQGHQAADDDALLTLATTAGIALESAQLFDEAKRRQEYGRRASEISNRILSVADDREARHIITTAVQRLAQADLVVWWHASPEDPEAVKVVAAAGPGSETFSGEEIFPLRTFDRTTTRGLLGLSATADRSSASPFATMLKNNEIDSLMLLPVGGEHGVRGWLMCGRRAIGIAFSELDLDLADIFIQQMSIALNLTAVQTLSERMRILEDRERIARDLHDHVIQSLFAVGLKIRNANDPTTSAENQVRLGEAVSEIDDSIRQLRSTIFQLNIDPSATVEDFSVAVGLLITALTPGLGFDPHITFEGPLDTVITPLLRAEIVAVLREAVTNTARYAHADHLTVTLVTDRRTLTLTVIDDGVGIGTATRRSGLDNLRMRAELLGGELDLDVPEGGGTALRWSIPLDPGSSSTERPTSRRED